MDNGELDKALDAVSALRAHFESQSQIVEIALQRLDEIEVGLRADRITGTMMATPLPVQRYAQPA